MGAATAWGVNPFEFLFLLFFFVYSSQGNCSGKTSARLVVHTQSNRLWHVFLVSVRTRHCSTVRWKGAPGLRGERVESFPHSQGLNFWELCLKELHSRKCAKKILRGNQTPEDAIEKRKVLCHLPVQAKGEEFVAVSFIDQWYCCLFFLDTIGYNLILSKSPER